MIGRLITGGCIGCLRITCCNPTPKENDDQTKTALNLVRAQCGCKTRLIHGTFLQVNKPAFSFYSLTRTSHTSNEEKNTQASLPFVRYLSVSSDDEMSRDEEAVSMPKTLGSRTRRYQSGPRRVEIGNVVLSLSLVSQKLSLFDDLCDLWWNHFFPCQIAGFYFRKSVSGEYREIPLIIIPQTKNVLILDKVGV